ncbi:MAG: hypothetical protein AAFY31_07260 [Pseudomonadota bacterium]
MIRPVASLTLSLAVLWSASSALAACQNPQQAEIYPTARILPENLLRIYVYFPRPMNPDHGLTHVRLVDAAGGTVEGAFLSNREDLWSPDRRRLTLILDPGRVKTGLQAHEALGRALEPGEGYAFEVSGNALGADGCALGMDTRHSFTVASADLEPPDPASWGLSVPKAQSTEPLEVTLGSTHDHLSLAFRLRVLDDTGAVVRGSISLGPNEESWEFKPSAPWADAVYTLAIDERLEDLAGNRPGLLFDRPLDQAPAAWDRRLAFTPLK